jgi:excisionase family DNA binding protein
MNTTTQFFNSEEAAQVLGVNVQTMRKYLRNGKVRGLRLGRDWRISGRALDELARKADNQPQAPARTRSGSTPNDSDASAAAILSGLQSDDAHQRNAAIIALTQADAHTSALVQERIAQSVAEYSGPEDDWSDWRALDSEPFHFPEEAKAEAEAAA